MCGVLLPLICCWKTTKINEANELSFKYSWNTFKSLQELKPNKLLLHAFGKALIKQHA